ncbi:hypothetical protein Bpfe_012502 [Biomphalaria pfeifferi]|uniref:Uncharacterized protein n=1 Tax=Biomphalaria pfeifferi TaxID=112525 RepID=A0AAD8BQ35_BIOPF|nr:hypothetical protein Bpfe_012502 [Biomphalaria pfeifferi]
MHRLQETKTPSHLVVPAPLSPKVCTLPDYVYTQCDAIRINRGQVSSERRTLRFTFTSGFITVGFKFVEEPLPTIPRNKGSIPLLNKQKPKQLDLLGKSLILMFVLWAFD